MPVEASPSPSAPTSSAAPTAPQRPSAKDKAPSGFNAILAAASDGTVPAAPTSTAAMPQDPAEQPLPDTESDANTTVVAADAAHLLTQALHIPADTSPHLANAEDRASGTTATEALTPRPPKGADLRPDGVALATTDTKTNAGRLHSAPHADKSQAAQSGLGDVSSTSSPLATGTHGADTGASGNSGHPGDKTAPSLADMVKALVAKSDTGTSDNKSTAITATTTDPKPRPTPLTTDLPPPTANGTSAPQSYSTAAAPILHSFESQLQEQVTYWIAQDVQHAEMTLDGMGKEAVEVSIRMQGNEAHVAFRTDELQTREALEQAGASLKDMLQRQGLLLTGVSVGLSHRGQEQGQTPESRPRQGIRHTQVGAATMDPLPVLGNRTHQGVHTLDLFV